MKAFGAALRRTEIQILLITISLGVLLSLATAAAPTVPTGV
ncbi:MAG TPA: hypothetical protein VN108_09595 [Marmoricola sp.]|nr:hypothetical protein [Marmoricola sp.]